MYEYFEYGFRDALGGPSYKLSSSSRQLLKKAFDAVPAYTGAQPTSEGGIPWGKLILLSLLAGGGAYAHGKMADNSPFAGFANGADNNVINPIIGRIKNLFGSPEEELNNMSGRVQQAGLIGQFNGVKNPSQLHGTEYHEPNALNRVAQAAGGAAGVGMLGGMVRPTARIAARVPYLGRAARTVAGIPGLKLLGRAAPGLGAASTIPHTLELGDKINDTLGIQNSAGRLAVQGGTVGLGLGSALGGAKAGMSIGRFFGPAGSAIGGIIGGIGGTMMPSLVNDTLNYKNNRTLQNNLMSGQANQLKLEFNNALQQKGFGNTHPLNAWYGLHKTPQQLQMTIDQFGDNPQFQNLIRTNNPIQ